MNKALGTKIKLNLFWQEHMIREYSLIILPYHELLILVSFCYVTLLHAPDICKLVTGHLTLGFTTCMVSDILEMTTATATKPRNSCVWHFFKYLKEDDKSICLATTGKRNQLTNHNLEREILLQQNKKYKGTSLPYSYLLCLRLWSRWSKILIAFKTVLIPWSSLVFFLDILIIKGVPG